MALGAEKGWPGWALDERRSTTRMVSLDFDRSVWDQVGK